MRGGDGDGGIAMSAVQQSSLFSSTVSLGSTSNPPRAAVKTESPKNQFPAGLRVLVVDDDPICLMILEKMLRRCAYDVTTCGQATVALAMLRENKTRFDLVISDVYMPDMDGFKLLELVGLEMDLPVIMMSADGETSAVMKGITHGACDYLLKPVRMEELRNIWQHVVRKKRNEVKEVEHSGSVEDNERLKRPSEDAEHTSSSNTKKRKDVKEEEDDNDHDIDDPTTLKKPRVVWSVELHQQFVSAVNQLGIDKAVPKRILELMSVQGLTRENVASHLQKYRLYLKRLSNGPQPNGMNLAFAGSQDSSLISPISSLEGMNGLHSLAASGHLTAQALASVQSGAIGRLGNVSGIGPTGLDSSVLLQLAALQGGSGGSFNKPRVAPALMKQGSFYQALPGGLELDQLARTQNVINQLEPLVDHATGESILQHQLMNRNIGGMGSMGGACNNLSTNVTGNALLMRYLQQQQAKQQIDGLSMPPGQHILPAEFSGNLGSLSNMGIANLNTEVGFSTLNSNVAPAVSYGLNSLYSTSHIDSKNLNLLGGVPSSNFPVGSSTTGPGLASSNVVSTPAVKNLAPNASIFDDTYAVQSIRSSILPFNTLGSVNHNIIQDSNLQKRVGWQGQSVGMNQDFVVTPSPIQSSHNSQIFTGPHLHTVFGQGQAQGHELVGQGPSFTRNDAGFMRPRSSQCNSEQSTTDIKLKEEPVSDSATTKLDSALSAVKAASSADDLLTLFLKQQQEMAGYSDNDLALDGYTPDNLYVK
ncbi:hypothetical protein O6H91_17G058300 [Diphasiastrum complanatum]|uniref:Uncharacterized protein n=2 Tax=Diphasiastrum complanatum TaxID=34168 RepID=A0ACC2B729_DIPCM|nr:hypothetical protein O6H91_17G058300 [Diphasiastrum complanatum]KAJ7525600.1 hypothetical protein O6H91_17G058300 [Diphasiastrum complanatum]